MRKWWRKPSPQEEDSLPFTPTTVAGLDVQAAVQRHQRLRQRLQACAQGDCDPVLDAAALCFDSRCQLGQWLHGPGQARLGQHRGFLDLLEQHRMFHIAASNVVALARAGRLAQAQSMTQGQLEAFSSGTLKRLNAMQSWVDRRNLRRQSLEHQQRLDVPTRPV